MGDEMQTRLQEVYPKACGSARPIYTLPNKMAPTAISVNEVDLIAQIKERMQAPSLPVWQEPATTKENCKSN